VIETYDLILSRYGSLGAIGDMDAETGGLLIMKARDEKAKEMLWIQYCVTIPFTPKDERISFKAFLEPFEQTQAANKTTDEILRDVKGILDDLNMERR
jgi:hypothetical protein